MIYCFGDFELDDELFELRRLGSRIEIEPRIFDVLAYLVRNPDRVVSKNELLDALWSGVSVSESVLPHCIAVARRATGDDRDRQAIIKTVHGRGYRFVAAVTRRGEQGPTAPDPDVPAALRRASTASAFVGRERTMHRLGDRLDLAFGGRGSVVALAGEPGIGKTRITEEFSRAAEARGGLVLFGRCYEGEGAPAFWPWLQVLRAYLRLRTRQAARIEADMGPGAVDIAELVPELREHLPGLAALEPLEGEQARFRLFDAIASFVRRLAREQPLVIVLDDLHWADEPSLRLTRFVAEDIHDSSALLMAAYRDQEARENVALGGLLAALARESHCVRIDLAGLRFEDARNLIEAVAGEPVADAVATAVHQRTAGNPFFTQEVARLLMSEAAGSERETWASRLRLPDTVRAVIGRRIDGLSEACARTLRAASIFGREFRASLLALVMDTPTSDLLERLTEAVEARLVDQDADRPGLFRFHHALTLETLYGAISPSQRPRLHRRAAEILESAYGAHPEPHLSELAHHWSRAALPGDSSKAVDMATRAAEHAQHLLAYEESARLYRVALDALKLEVPVDEERRCSLLLSLGESQSRAGAVAASRSSFEAAGEIARRIDRPELLARAALGYRGPAEMGTPPEEATLALLDEALTLVGETNAALRARLLSRQVGTPPHANSMEMRNVLSREALALAQAAGDATAMGEALSARLWASLGPDAVEERFGVAHELFDLSERTGDKQMARLGHEGKLGAHLLRGEIAAAERELEAMARIADELRQPAYIVTALFIRGSLAVARGEFDAGERCFEEARDRGRRTFPYVHFAYTGQMYLLRMQRTGVEDEELGRVMFGEMFAPPYSWERAVQSGLAYLLANRGDREGARRELDTLAKEGFTDIRRDEHWLISMYLLAGTAVAVEDRKCARLVYDLLLPYANLVVVHDLLRSVHGTVASTLGGLATLLELYDIGLDHFERAISVETEAGLRPSLLRSKIGCARLLLRRARPGDVGRAATLLDEAVAGGERIGHDHPQLLTAIEELRGIRNPGH